MKGFHMLTFTLLAIGGLNWLLVGVFNFDLVSFLLGTMTGLSRTVYVLVGLSALWEIFTHKANCRYCSTPKAM